MSEYLDTSDLHMLTGYKQHVKQAEWLRDNSIPHRVDITRVIVAHQHVASWLCGKPVSFGEVNFGAVK